MGFGGCQGLRVWNKAVDLSDEVGRLVRRLPSDERFELSSQLRRAADSISSNIAEGSGRSSIKDDINFLHNAKGSNLEVQTQLRLCVRHGYLSEQDIRKAVNLSISVHKLLVGQIESLKRKDEEVRAAKKMKARIEMKK